MKPSYIVRYKDERKHESLKIQLMSNLTHTHISLTRKLRRGFKKTQKD